MLKVMYIFLAIAVVAGILSLFLGQPAHAPVPETAPESGVPADVPTQIAAKADLITLTVPAPMAVVTSPLTVAGSARGNWYFEGSFPVILTDWDGLIIAEGIATADGEWMTTDFVPFRAELTFTNPYPVGGQDFMKRGSLILKKDNPSGLSEHDDALEISVRFAP